MSTQQSTQEKRYLGEYTLEGQPRHFNIMADSEEDVWERLMGFHPGKTVRVDWMEPTTKEGA